MEHPSGTTKLFPTGYIYGAGEGDRTLATSLEGWGSTTELHPQINFGPSRHSHHKPKLWLALAGTHIINLHYGWWRRLDSNQ